MGIELTQCKFETRYIRKSSWKGSKDIDMLFQCQKENGHEGWCDYNDGETMISWKAEESMNKEEKLDQCLSLLMMYCEDKYAYKKEISEILTKIREMMK